MSEKPHVTILGAGPTGLEAALAAAEHGFPFTVYEAANGVAGHVRRWSHVRLFTAWDLSASPRLRRALAAAGRAVPESADDCPTGGELIAEALQPAAELPQLRDRLRFGVTVRRIGRRGLLKHEEIGTAERGRRPFRLLVRDAEGKESVEETDVILDCTGVSLPNPLGDGGIPALGEEALDGKIFHEIPDLVAAAGEWTDKKILLVGSGYSAQTAARDLFSLAGSGAEVVWVLRSEQPDFGEFENDPLPERARLAAAARVLLEDPPPGLDVRAGAVVEALRPSAGRVEVTLRRGDAAETVTVDRVLALTGKVGDHLLYRQLQVHECYATQGPMKLAAALLSTGAAAGGDCLDQSSQGADTLRNPEPGFFILGSKSYGRRNDFLMRVGWQQVDEVFSLLEE